MLSVHLNGVLAIQMNAQDTIRGGGPLLTAFIGAIPSTPDSLPDWLQVPYSGQNCRQRSIRTFASARLRNHSRLSSSSRSLPLKLSTNPFCQGLPGATRPGLMCSVTSSGSTTRECVVELPGVTGSFRP